MSKRFVPKTLTKYLIKEFSFLLLIFFLIFSALIVLSTYVEEIIFFKNKEIIDNFFLEILIFSLIKSPTLILNFSPFIFLFTGILFYVKFIKNNEITSMSLSGLSKNLITLIPAIYSFILGVLIIIIFTPITAELTKYYETIKKRYSDNDNLIIMSDTGLWIKEKKNNDIYIIRADKIKKDNFSTLNNLSIFIFENKNFKERIDGESAKISNNTWIVTNAKVLFNSKYKKIEKYKYQSKIDWVKLEGFFNNPDIYSIWNILNELNEIRERGYFGQELIIKLNKYLSLPFLLFSMIVLSTVFTINADVKHSNFKYSFFAIFSGIIIYFMSDLSIAIGKSDKIPLVLSVWVPVILIMIFSTYSLLKNNE